MAPPPIRRIDRDEILEKALQLRMTVTLIARATGISRSAVSQWRRVPERHLAIVARITGISERRLRPDLYRGTQRRSSRALEMAAE